jgi:hypothetical protein
MLQKHGPALRAGSFFPKILQESANFFWQVCF